MPCFRIIAKCTKTKISQAENQPPAVCDKARLRKMTEEMLYPKYCFEQFRTNPEITLGVYSIADNLTLSLLHSLLVEVKLVLSMLLLPEVSTMCMILSRRPNY